MHVGILTRPKRVLPRTRTLGTERKEQGGKGREEGAGRKG
jgi:hypothetical protein